MQVEHGGGQGNAGRRRVEAVVQTLATLGGHGESLAEVAHDARNMVTALGLYCDLLEEPGVLAVPFAHYSNELRLVAAASRRLVEKLVALDNQAGNVQASDTRTGSAREGFDDRREGGSPGGQGEGDPTEGGVRCSSGLPDPAFRKALGQSPEQSPGLSPGMSSAPEFNHGLDWPAVSSPAPGGSDVSLAARAVRSHRWDSIFAEPINNLAGELAANRNLLAALAGSGIVVGVDTEGGDRPVHLTAEDLTRLLVNMVKNAAEAMPSGGRVHIGLREKNAGRLLLTMEDTGPGIPAELLDRVFESGFTTHSHTVTLNAGWPAAHRGLGLAITRSIIEAAGGRISAANRAGTGQTGARFEIELPVRSF